MIFLMEKNDFSLFLKLLVPFYKLMVPSINCRCTSINYGYIKQSRDTQNVQMNTARGTTHTVVYMHTSHLTRFPVDSGTLTSIYGCDMHMYCVHLLSSVECWHSHACMYVYSSLQVTYTIYSFNNK